MRVLGIDPGTAIMGWGIIEEKHGTLQTIHYGTVQTSPNQTPAQRLLLLHEGLVAILQEFHPDESAIEEVFFSRNVTTALAVGQARGVILLTLAQQAIPIYEYNPLAVKQAISGYGGAGKRQMQEMVRLTLQLKAIPQPDDAADALAIAICHVYTSPMLRQNVTPN